MNILVRLLGSTVCVVVLLFCCFGFLATFEPMAFRVQLTWRVIYSVFAILAIGGVVIVNRRGKSE